MQDCRQVALGEMGKCQNQGLALAGRGSTCHAAVYTARNLNFQSLCVLLVGLELVSVSQDVLSSEIGVQVSRREEPR